MEAIGENIQSMYWVCPLVVILGYYTYELVVTRKIARKLGEHPLVGSPSSLIPRAILNLIFAARAVEVLEHGYRKFKDRAFQLIRNSGSVMILPLSTIDELSSLPVSVASPSMALEHDLLGPYTSLDIILECRLHHSIVQRKLTPRLAILTPALETELTASFDDFFPTCRDDEWTEIQPFKLLGKVAARLSARALVGPSTCRDPTWLDISVNYTENLFKTIVMLRMFPGWTHPFLSRCLPSYWAGRGYVKSARAVLSPTIRELIRKNDEGSWSPETANEEDYHVLAWLADTAKGRDRNPDTLAHVEVLLALASVHTTLLRMVNVLYDLTAHPELFNELRDEIRGIQERNGISGWNESSYAQLYKLDSVLRESQRLSPPTVLGLKRLFRESYTFSNGVHVPQGTYVALPIMAIENDPRYTTDPAAFDGLRSYRLRLQEGLSNDGGEKKNKNESDHQFSSIERTVLNFGYGKSACPGRYFASLAIKMVMVKLLTDYDFQFLPGTGRPKNYVVHEFLFPWPWDRIQMKRNEKGICPF